MKKIYKHVYTWKTSGLGGRRRKRRNRRRGVLEKRV